MATHDAEVRALLERTHTLRCRGQYEEALPLARRAVAVAPQSREAWQQLGSTYGSLQRVADLEAAFKRALLLAQTPWDEVETWFYRGIAENNACAWEAASRSFTQLTALEPEWGTARLIHAMVLGNLGAFRDRRYYAEALVVLDQVAIDQALGLIDLSPADECMAYSLKAGSLRGLGRSEEAEACDKKGEDLLRADRATSSPPRRVH